MFYKKKKKKTLKIKKIFLGIFTNWLLNKFASILVGEDKKQTEWEVIIQALGISSVFSKAKYVNAKER